MHDNRWVPDEFATPDAAPGGRRLSSLLVGALLLANVVVTLDHSGTVVALPAIRDTFGTGIGALVWVQIAPAIAGVAIAGPGGAVGDRLGRGRVMLAGMAIFAAGALGSALAPSRTGAGPWELITARFLAGAGDTVITVLSLALLTSSVTRARIAWMVGFWTAFSSGAAALAPFVSGVIVDTLGWRWVFGLPVIPMAAAALVMLVTRPQFASTAGTTVGWTGGALLAGALSLLAAGVAAVDKQGSGLANAAILLAAGAVLLVGFAVAQRRSADPLVRWSQLRAPGIIAALVVRALVALTFAGAMFEVTLLLLNALGYSPAAAGAMDIPPAAAAIAASAASSGISGRIGTTRARALGCAALGVGVAGTSAIGDCPSPWLIGASLTIVGAGYGLLTATLGAAVLAALPRGSHGQGSGALAFAGQGPGVLGVSLIGIITAAVTQGVWRSQTTGPCGTDPRVLSAVGSGALSDIADRCGDALGATARTIYIDGVTSVLRVVAVILGLVAVGALWGYRRVV